MAIRIPAMFRRDDPDPELYADDYPPPPRYPRDDNQSRTAMVWQRDPVVMFKDDDGHIHSINTRYMVTADVVKEGDNYYLQVKLNDTNVIRSYRFHREDDAERVLLGLR